MNQIYPESKSKDRIKTISGLRIRSCSLKNQKGLFLKFKGPDKVNFRG